MPDQATANGFDKFDLLRQLDRFKVLDQIPHLLVAKPKAEHVLDKLLIYNESASPFR